MSGDRALLIDADEVFERLLRESLEGCPLELLTLGGSEQLDRHRDLLGGAALVLIGVELPDKAGFGTFSRVRTLAPRVPAVLVTATLSTEELSLHAKLRQHADLYLDKRLLTREILRQALAPLVPDAIPETAGNRAAISTATGATVGLGTDARTRWLARDVSSQEFDVLLAAISDETAEGDGEEGLTPARFARLQSQVDRLREELREARRAAEGSPFSEEFRRLGETARQQETELTYLRTEIGHRDARLHELQTRLAAVEEERDAAAQAREEALHACRGLTHRAVRAEERARELERAARHQAQEHAAGQQDLLAKLRGAGEALEAAERDSELRRAAFEEREEQLRAAHAKALDELRAEHALQTESLQTSWEQRLERAGEEARERLREARAEAGAEADARLAELQRKHRDELEALRRSSGAERERERAAHAEELAAREQEAEALRAQAVETARGELLARLAGLERSHEKAVSRLQEQHERTLAALKKEHADEAETRARALAMARAEFESAMAEARGAHAEELAALQRTHEQEIEGLRAEAERERTSGEQEAAATLDSLVRQLRRDGEARVEALKEAHARELAAREQEARERLEASETARTEERAAYERELEAQKTASDARLQELAREQERALAVLGQEHEGEVASLREALTTALAAAPTRAGDRPAAELEPPETARDVPGLLGLVDELHQGLESLCADSEQMGRAGGAEAEPPQGQRARELDQVRATLVSLRAVLDDVRHTLHGLADDADRGTPPPSRLRDPGGR